MTPLFTAEVLGNLPSMKNQRRIITNRRTGKPMSIKSESAMEYEASFLAQIARNRTKLPLDSTIPLSLKARVWYKSRRNDLDIEFLKDLLQKSGVVENDRQFVHQEAWKGLDRENPRVCFSIHRALVEVEDG